MKKLAYIKTITTARAVFTGCFVMAGSLCLPSIAGAVTPGTPLAAFKLAQPAENPANLDTKRLYALGMIETGNDDRAVGAAGEVSRYQLAPPVWHTYSRSMDYQNPEVSLQVARQHWTYLASYFREKTGRMPTDFDMYVMWNTRLGYYSHKGFSRRLLSPVVEDRAQRFVNLVHRKG